MELQLVLGDMSALFMHSRVKSYVIHTIVSKSMLLLVCCLVLGVRSTGFLPKAISPGLTDLWG